MLMKIRWQAWYGDHEIALDFPGGWRVNKVQMAGAPAAEPDALFEGLQNPIGSPTLKDLARDSNKAVIVVEDITRPSPLDTVLQLVLAELQDGGLKSEDIFFIMGLGAHAPMRRQELSMKLGINVLDNYRVYQNHSHDNREYVGETRRGTPVYINSHYKEADLRISVGTIVPHGHAGFAGGVKTVAVGVAAVETLYANHTISYNLPHSMAGRLRDNEMRADLEEIAGMLDHRFVVNTVVNSRRELVALFAGDPIKAHAVGAKFAHRVYGTKLPALADVAVFNAYPKDTDLVQVGNSMNAVTKDLQRAIKPDGSAVLATACSQGAGIHFLLSSGMRANGPIRRETLNLGKHGLVIYSPNLSLPDIREFPPDTLLFNEWPDVIAELTRRHGDHATVSVFPNGAIQIPADIIESE